MCFNVVFDYYAHYKRTILLELELLHTVKKDNST